MLKKGSDPKQKERYEKLTALFWLFLQLICILFYGLFCEYGHTVDTNDEEKNLVYKFYNTFQDVHVMM